MNRTAGIVLATKLSRRLDHPKQLLLLDDRPLVMHVVERAITSRLNEVIVVTNALEDRIQVALNGLPIHFVHNERFADKQKTSLATKIATLDKKVDAVMILLADQPAISPHVIDLEIETQQLSRTPVMMARYSKDHEHPMLFGHKLFPELSRLDNDTNKREIIQTHQHDVIFVDSDADVPPADVDTKKTYAALRKT